MTKKNQPGEKPVRVLVVEDDANTAQSTCRLMTQAGYSASVVGTGRDALQTVHTARPDLVLLDRHLPDMDGLDVCRQIKADPALGDIFVIIASASSVTRTEQVEGLKSGADSYISRPIGNHELAARVETIVRILHMRRALREKNEALEKEVAERRRAEVLAKSAHEETAQLLELAEQSRRALLSAAEDQEAATAALRENEQHLADVLNFSQTVIRAAPVGVLVYKASGECVSVNDAAVKIIGCTKEQALKQNFRQLESWKRGGMLAAADVALTTQAEHIIEDHLTSSFGRTAWLTCRFVPFRHDNEQHLLLTTTDITERKQQEQEIARLNRLYAVLSRINQSIVRVQSREELFAEICRAIIESGRFKLTWIGWLNPETKEVLVAAKHGEAGTEAYLKNVRIYADDRPEGRGPTGICIREARTYICNDFQNDPAYLLWREAAARHGLAGSIAVPIRFGGGVCGALMVYAAELNFFGEKEVALMEEAALNISFALDHLEQEQKRQRADEALRTSESRFRSLFENMTEGFAHCRMLFENGRPTDFIYLDVNAAFTTQTGLKDVVGRKVSEVIPGIHKWDPDLLEHYGRVATTGRPERFENYVPTLDMWFDISVYSPEKEHFVAVFDVITGRKRAEEALRASEKRYQLISSVASDYMFSSQVQMDGQLRLEWVTGAFERMTGFTMEEYTARGGWRAMLHPDDRAQDEHDMAQLRAGQRMATEVRTLTKSGAVQWVRVYAHPVLDEVTGQLTGIYGAVQDITGQKQAEAILRENEERFRQIFENSPLGMATVSSAMYFTKANAAFCRMLNYTDQEFAALTVKDVTHPEHMGQDTEAIQKLMAGEISVYRTEKRYVRKDRTTVWGTLTLTTVRDLAGRFLYLLAMIEDISERKRMAMALAESRNFLDKIINTVADPVFVKDRQHRWVLLNDACCDFVGRKREEILGKSNYDVFPKDEADISWARDEVVFNTGKEDINEEKYTNARGEVRSIVTKKALYTDEKGEQFLVGLISDITERKKTEEALQASQALYHSFVEQMPGAAFRKDREGRYVMVNRRYCQMKGLNPENFLGKKPTEIPDNPEVGQGRFQMQTKYAVEGEDAHLQILRTGKTIETEEEHFDAEGRRLLLQVVRMPVYGGDGRIVGTQGLQFDVTARREAEMALRESNAFNESLLQTIPFGIDIVDGQGRILFMNVTMEKAVGKSVLGARCWEHYRDDRQQCANRPLHQPIVVGETKNTESTGVLGGKIFEISHTGMLFRGQKAVLEVFYDVTGRRKLEEQFRQSQKMEAIGQLAGGVAHDFNNILAVIQMQADLLKTEDNPSPSQLESARDIGAAAQRAAALTRQLLLFSRKETVLARDLDLNEAIGNMTKMLRRILGEDIQTQFNFALQPVYVHADPGMMDQVLMNLAVNARDAMPDGGRLMIETAAVEFDKGKEAQSPQGRPGSYVCLSVSDTGCGIPAENLTKIFEPFFTTKDVGKGTGLGLAVIHGIVEQHKGWVEVQSEVGRGTTFRVYLPRLVEMSGQNAEQVGLASMPRGDETILLVEDDAFLRVSVGKVLAQLGYQVIQAVNGVEALKVWKERREEIDLVLTDLVMPEGMNGKEMVEEMMKDEPGLNVIYTSGYSDDVAGKDSGFELREGVNFLSKPFHADKLAQTIRARLDD